MIPNCPKCNSQYIYEDGELFICPECSFEFDKEYEEEGGLVVTDAHGNRLSDGDDVIVIKDLCFKGGVERWYESQECSSLQRRSQHRLQNPRYRRNKTQKRIC